MRKLQNYSIETDKLVWLEFSDGESLRVNFGQISDHLTGPDLAKVKRAFKLRRDFMRHFPRTMAFVAAASLAAFLIVDSRAVAHLWNGARPVQSAPVVSATAAAAIATPTPTLSPAPTVRPTADPAVSSAATPKAAPSLAPVAPAAPVPSPQPVVQLLNQAVHAVTSLLP